MNNPICLHCGATIPSEFILGIKEHILEWETITCPDCHTKQEYVLEGDFKISYRKINESIKSDKDQLQCTNCGKWIDRHLIEIEDYENNPICMCNDCFENNEEYNKQWDIMFAKIQKTVADIKSKSSDK